MSTIEKRAIDIIKLKFKALGLTQSQVAKSLNVSLPTVKRWLRGKGLTLTVIERLCTVVGISLSSLFLETDSGYGNYVYTPEQEKMFVAHPKVLALYDLLVSGETTVSIHRRYSITKDEMFSMLLKLDKAGLIELYENNKIKLLFTGEPQWIPGGQLSQTYRLKMIKSFLGDHEKSKTSFFVHNYLPDDAIQIKSKIKELEHMMLSFNIKGNLNKENRKSYGAYLALKEFEWDLRDQLKK